MKLVLAKLRSTLMRLDTQTDVWWRRQRYYSPFACDIVSFRRATSGTICVQSADSPEWSTWTRPDTDDGGVRGAATG